MVEAEGLGKRYGWTWALRGVDLEVGPGERVLVFGPNGAGKTTLLKLIAGILRPSEGRVKVGGADDLEMRRKVGMVGHRPLFYGKLTVRENLSFYGKLYGVPRLRYRTEELLERVGLRHMADLPCEVLSRGMAQRLSLAKALLHDPPVLLLDEPFSGMDPEGRRFLEELLGDDGRTVIMTTYDVGFGVRWAEKVLVLVRGGPRYLGPPPRNHEELMKLCE